MPRAFVTQDPRFPFCYLNGIREIHRRAYGCRKILRCAFWSQNPKQKVTFLSPEMDPVNDGTGWTPQPKLQHPAGSRHPLLWCGSIVFIN